VGELLGPEPVDTELGGDTDERLQFAQGSPHEDGVQLDAGQFAVAPLGDQRPQFANDSTEVGALADALEQRGRGGVDGHVDPVDGEVEDHAAMPCIEQRAVGVEAGLDPPGFGQGDQLRERGSQERLAETLEGERPDGGHGLEKGAEGLHGQAARQPVDGFAVGDEAHLASEVARAGDLDLQVQWQGQSCSGR
jgi:hypothetical protein